MNFFCLARRSVIRKSVKSILLLLVVFVISTLVLSCIASQNASIYVQDHTRQAIGAGLLLEANDEYRSRRIEELAKQLGNKEGTLEGYFQKRIMVNGMESWQTGTDNSFETLKLEDIIKLANTEGIEDYNITTKVTAVNPVNFERIEDEDVDQSADIKGVSLIGNKDMKMDVNVLSGNLYFKEGRGINPDDSNVCVISEDLAKKNNIQLGDKLAFNDYHDRENSEIFQAKVIGIYQVKKKMTPIMHGDTYRSENIIFTDLNFPHKPEGETCPLIQSAYFKVKDVDEYDEIKDRMEHTDIDWERYDLIDNNGNSEIMSSDFKDIARIGKGMMLIIATASVIVLILIFLFWLKNRTKEMGIFLSLGNSKCKIIGQIWAEAIMIALVAVILSFTVAETVSNVTTTYLISQQIQKSEEEREMNKDRVATEYDDPKQDIQEVEVIITPEMYALDGISIVILITASVFVSSIVIVRKNPRDILSEMS